MTEERSNDYLPVTMEKTPLNSVQELRDLFRNYTDDLNIDNLTEQQQEENKKLREKESMIASIRAITRAIFNCFDFKFNKEESKYLLKVSPSLENSYLSLKNYSDRLRIEGQHFYSHEAIELINEFIRLEVAYLEKQLEKLLLSETDQNQVRGFIAKFKELAI